MCPNCLTRNLGRFKQIGEAKIIQDNFNKASRLFTIATYVCDFDTLRSNCETKTLVKGELTKHPS